MKTIGIERTIRSLLNCIKRHDTEILMSFGIAGMVSGTILAVKATPKAVELIEKEKKEKQVEKLDVLDTVKVTWKCYIPTVLTEAISLSCLVCAGVSNNKRSAALAAAYTLSETTLREYQEKVIETIGEKKESAIQDEIAKDKAKKLDLETAPIIFTGKGDTLCLESICGTPFESDVEKIRRALNDINEQLINENYVSLNDWYYALGLPPAGIGDAAVGDLLGWNINDGQIDVIFSSQLTEDKRPCLVIGYRKPPYYYYQSRY